MTGAVRFGELTAWDDFHQFPGVLGRAELVVRPRDQERRAAYPRTARATATSRTGPEHDPANHFAAVTGTGDWMRYEVTAEIPPDANNIIFGVFLTGPGQIELRSPELQPQLVLPG